MFDLAQPDLNFVSNHFNLLLPEEELDELDTDRELAGTVFEPAGKTGVAVVVVAVALAVAAVVVVVIVATGGGAAEVGAEVEAAAAAAAAAAATQHGGLQQIGTSEMLLFVVAAANRICSLRCLRRFRSWEACQSSKAKLKACNNVYAFEKGQKANVLYVYTLT